MDFCYSRVFEVSFTTVVDRPDRRNESFPKVDPGKRVPHIMFFESERGAVAYFDQLVAGEWDFESEYVTDIQVIDVKNGNRSNARTVRKTVERTRKAAA